MKNQQVNFEDSNYFKKLYYFVTTPFVKFIYHQVRGTLSTIEF